MSSNQPINKEGAFQDKESNVQGQKWSQEVIIYLKSHKVKLWCIKITIKTHEIICIENLSLNDKYQILDQ